MSAQLIAQKETYNFRIPLIFAALIMLFLFYIDEGYYNFNWMLNVGAWIVYAIYVGALFALQVSVQLVANVICIKSQPNYTFISIITALAHLALLIYLIFFSR